MHGTHGKSSLAAYAGGLALVAAIGVAACQGHSSPIASGSPSPSSVGRSTVIIPASVNWSAARASLPTAAKRVSGQFAQLTDVSCPTVGTCVAVGGVKASGDVTQGLIEMLSDSTWTPTTVPGLSSRSGAAPLNAVSCRAQVTCVAVGFVGSATNVFTPVIETLSGGRWSRVKPPLPDDAATTASATLNDIACPAAGTCVATGWYVNQGGDRNGYVDMLSNGTWTAASAVLPKDAASEQSSAAASTFLAAVSCAGVGACVASGQYRDTHGQTRALIETLSGGAWTATAAPLPADAAATGQVSGLWAVDCPSPGACVAAGHYIVRGGQPRFLTDTLAGGAWTAAAIPLPAEAAADQKWSQYVSTTVGGLACPSAGYCVASAGYVTKANQIVPVIETLSDGAWTPVVAPLPADAAPGTGQGNAAYLELVTCPAAGHCLIAGSYPADDGTVEGLIEVSVPG